MEVGASGWIDADGWIYQRRDYVFRCDKKTQSRMQILLRVRDGWQRVESHFFVQPDGMHIAGYIVDREV